MRNKMLVYIVWVFVLALGVQSCNNDPMPDAPKGKYPILFRCSDETRAEATVESMKADTDGFNVYAYFETNTNEKVSFEKNVWWNESEGMWLYDDIEYWIVGATYWFKAVYPHGIATVDNSNSTQTVTITGYDVTNQDDILVAETDRGGMLVTEQNQAPTSGSVVSLNFQHLLANVTIKVLSELATPVEVERIELRNIASQGDYNGNWIANDSKCTLGIDSDITLNKAESDTDYTDITDGGFIVIPEQINGTQKLYIKTSFKEYEISVPTTLSWSSGKKYSYTLTINQEYIEFNEPKVDIWDEENATGSVVIK
ncbi:MAG: fimbrillin family protein [Alistipes sp.]|nr:fimbrillin family protein [Alistipes sp.]